MISIFIIGVIVGLAARPILAGFAALRRRSLTVDVQPVDPFAASPGLPAPPPRSSGWLLDSDPTPPSGTVRPRLPLRRSVVSSEPYDFPF